MTTFQLLDLYMLLLNNFYLIFSMFMMQILRGNIARFLLSYLVLEIVFWFKQDVVSWNRFRFI